MHFAVIPLRESPASTRLLGANPRVIPRVQCLNEPAIVARAHVDTFRVTGYNPPIATARSAVIVDSVTLGIGVTVARLTLDQLV